MARTRENGASPSARGGTAAGSVGSLCKDLPAHVAKPPIEAVVFGWGVAEDGQLGVDSGDNVLMPKVVEALLGTRFCGRSFLTSPLIGGSRNSLALDAEGQVLSWGWNARATLGLGHGQEFVRKPRRVSALQAVTVAQVTTGGWHCLAVTEGGQAFAWGGNEYGQCGLPSTQRDVRAPTRCVPHLTVTQVAAGGMHSCVLTASGEIWTWGEPWGDFSMQVDRQPRAVSGATNVAKIACGAFHNLALTWEGRVLAWGINDFGQLGNGSTDYEVTPTPVLGLEDVGVADIAAGGWHSLALTAAGEVYVWGRGEYGRLGLGDASGSSRLRAARVPGLEGHRIVQAACGGTHTMVLTEEGRVFSWGRCSYGRLGAPTERDCYSPVEVYLPGGPERWRVISICCGGRHSLALALPDNDASSRPLSRSQSQSGSELGRLPPGEPLPTAASPPPPPPPPPPSQPAAAAAAAQQPPSRAAAADLLPESEEFAEEDENLGGRTLPGRHSSQGLVAALDREEAEAEAEEQEAAQNGLLAGEEAGLSGVASPGGDSPGLPGGRPQIDQQQLQTMLHTHGLRDVESDD